MAGIIVLALAYIISHFYRSFLAVLSPALSSELGMSPAELSSALGAWFLTFALCQFVVGVLLDRVGAKTTSASMFAIGAGGGGLLFATAQSAFTIKVAMVALGAGCAPILMASVYIFKRSYESRRFATLTSTFIAVGLAGNILGSSPLAWATEAYGWRSVMVGLSLTTIILSVLIMVLVTDPPPAEKGTHGHGSYLDILKLRELWWILPLVFFNYAVGGGLRGVWSGPYLDIVHGLDASGIGMITLGMAIAMTVGSFVYGPADRIFNTRKWVILAGGVVSFVALMFWALNPAVSANTVTIILIVIGFFSLFYGLLMAHATANIPDHLAGRGVTLVNFFNMGGVGVMQWVTGRVYEGNTVDTDPAAGFASVIWIYAIGYAIVLALYALSKDAKPTEKSAS